jgi:small subunit ribosomal protein S3Ae
MAKAKRRAAKAGPKKVWIPILAPALFNKQQIGETYVTEASKAVGKTVPVNLMNLTGDMRQQNINVVFEINSVSGSKLYSEMIGFKMLPSSLKRMVRRGKNKVDYSFKAKTADGYRLKVKVIMVTIGLTKLSATTRLRKTCKEEFKKYFENTKYEKFVDELVHHRVQGSMKKLLSKAYPLRMFEVRHMEVIKKGEAEKKKVSKPKEKEAASKETKPAEAKKDVKAKD